MEEKAEKRKRSKVSITKGAEEETTKEETKKAEAENEQVEPKEAALTQEKKEQEQELSEEEEEEEEEEEVDDDDDDDDEPEWPKMKRRRRRRDEPSLEDVVEAYFDRVKSLVPPDFVIHMRAARKEVYLAIRSLIDARIEALEEADERSESRRPKRVRIE